VVRLCSYGRKPGQDNGEDGKEEHLRKQVVNNAVGSPMSYLWAEVEEVKVVYGKPILKCAVE
jgi:hypothetical protein